MSVQNVQTSSKVPTQCERIRQYIKDFGSITTYEAVMDIGVLRLGARISEMRKRGEEVPVDAFGHPRLDKVNVGQYFAKRFGELLGAEKTQVFKSGYFARSAAPCKKDLDLIQKCCALAVDSALAGVGGVVGKDEDDSNTIRACEFTRVKGGKPFNVRNSRFRKMLREIGQPRVRKTRVVKK